MGILLCVIIYGLTMFGKHATKPSKMMASVCFAIVAMAVAGLISEYKIDTNIWNHWHILLSIVSFTIFGVLEIRKMRKYIDE